MYWVSPKGKGPDPSALYLRMDERAARIIVVPGDTDRVITVGWEVRDHAALQRVKAALDGAGVAFKELSQDEADARRVEEVITFEDPAGTTPGGVPRRGARPQPGDHAVRRQVRHRRSGHGPCRRAGHDPNGLFDFYTEVLGFRSRGSFRIPTPPEFGPIRVRFLGINERHHSLAICPVMQHRDPGVVHIMVEVDTLDAVGQALDRVNAEGIQVSSTLGRHTNDKMVSFYIRTPGDWDIEFGTDGMRVDENHYTAEEITADSYWGHQWVSDLPAAMRP